MGAIRLARPTYREGSTYIQYDRRIPKAVLHRVRGLTLLIPVGSDVIEKRISASAVHIKLSLRTSDKTEGKLRHAQVDEYLERVYAGLLTDAPVKLTHRECVALSGVFYEAWSGDVKHWPANVTDQGEVGTPKTFTVGGGLIDAGVEADELTRSASRYSCTHWSISHGAIERTGS